MSRNQHFSRARLQRASALLGTVAVLSFGLPLAANAQTVVQTDSDADQYVWDPLGWYPTSDASDGNATGVVLTHTDKRVEVRVTFTAIPDASQEFFTVQANFRTDADVRGHMTYYQGGYPTKFEVVRKNGKQCLDGLSSQANFDGNYLVMSFPRACIGNPTWLRFQVEVNHRASLESPSYLDDALSDAPRSSDREKLAWSPRVYTADEVALTRRNADTEADSANDMYYWAEDAEGGGVDPERINGDISNTTMVHKENRVAGVIRFAELDHVDTESMRLSASFQTERGWGGFGITFRPGHWDGTPGFSFTNYETDNTRTSCTGLKWKIDYEANTFTFSFPRACLARPDWVEGEAHISIEGGSRVDTENPYYEYSDAALAAGDGESLIAPKLYRP